MIRFPWSLVSVPLILLGWYHFSGQPNEKPRSQGVQTAGMMGGSSHRAGGRRRERAEDGAQEAIVQASANVPETDLAASGAESARSTDSAEPSGAQDSNTRCRAKIVGEWEDDYQGKRHLTVNEDGTGAMVVELDGIGKKLFAAKLSFDLEWSASDGRIAMKTLGGEPESKVQLVLKLYGNEADYKILELTDDRMLLLDGDGKTRYDWRRPAASASE
ncbi:MAG TPA: hypothetical protein VGH74_02245 [Planctomycetaceae bacterium]